MYELQVVVAAAPLTSLEGRNILKKKGEKKIEVIKEKGCENF